LHSTHLNHLLFLHFIIILFGYDDDDDDNLDDGDGEEEKEDDDSMQYQLFKILILRPKISKFLL
jgi:hypothetical protein